MRSLARGGWKGLFLAHYYFPSPPLSLSSLAGPVRRGRARGLRWGLVGRGDEEGGGGFGGRKQPRDSIYYIPYLTYLEGAILLNAG